MVLPFRSFLCALKTTSKSKLVKNLLFNRSALAIAFGLVTLASCKKDDDDTKIPEYTVPATYSFENTDYSEATVHVKMMVSLNSYMSSGSNAKLDQVKADNLWNNTNNPFANDTMDKSGFAIGSRTADATTFKGFVDAVVAVSQNYTDSAYDGKAGRLTRGSGSKALVGATGLENNQAVAKGVMGSLLFKEAVNLLSNIGNVDNSTIIAGKGTAMQHNWDLAFGYLSIPTDYDTSKTYPSSDPKRPLLWGGYLAERGKYIKAGGTMWEAFRKGRAAIAVKDYTTRDACAKTIMETWEKLSAAAAWNYMKSPQSGTNLADKLHGLSEGYGFILSLKYRASGSKLSAENYNKLLVIANTNFYTLLNEPGYAKLNEGLTILTNAYGQLQP